MYRRGIARIVAATLLLGATGLASSLPAFGQAAPADGSSGTTQAPLLLQYGWWNKAQQSPTGGGGAPLPPNAPADGIYVAYEPAGAPPPAPLVGVVGIIDGTTATVGGTVAHAPDPTGPAAFGAVQFSVPEFSEGILTLKYKPTSSSQPGGVNTNAGDLFACPVSTRWDPVQNGRYESAPKYDCTIGVKAAYSGDTVVFTLPSALSSAGLFDLALVPGASLTTSTQPAQEQPYTLSVFAPSDASLMLTSVPESAATTEEFDSSSFEDPAAAFDTSGGEDFSTTVDEFTTEGATSFGNDFGSSFSSTEGGVVRKTHTSTTAGRRVVAVPASAGLVNPFRPDASRAERMMAVAILLALVVGLWWIGGQPLRPPRLLGSLGTGQTVETAALSTGGIGRFAKVRSALRPPRLF